MLEEKRFAALWHRLGASTDPKPLFAALAGAYAEPHRAYHTAAHLADCLAQLDAVRDALLRPDEAEMALWFHDAVYDPRAPDNEERSAAWAARELSAADVPTEAVARISDLVLATKHQAPPEGQDARIVIDVDLSILGREPVVFDVYDQAIRVEYAWVPEEQYREARARILTGFLSRPFLYQTEDFRARFEGQARANLRRAIDRLAGGADSP